MALLVPLLVFLSILVALVGGYLLLAPGGAGGREVRERLSLLSLNRVAGAEMPDALKGEILGVVPAASRVLSRLGATVRMEKRLRQAGLQMKAGTFLLLTGTAFVAGLLPGLLLRWPFFLTAATALVVSFVPRVVVGMKRRMRLARFVSHFPDALDMFARSLRAGHSFTGSLQTVAQEMPDPVGPEFRQVFDEQNLGVPLREALEGMTERVESLDVKFFVTAVFIQRETGGNLAEIIDKISHVIRERFRIQGQLKVFTAQARMTGIILALLPIGVALAIGAINPDYLKPLWTDRAGRIMVGVAAVMQVAGALVIRKIIRIKI
jgi:tight adherence protein B